MQADVPESQVLVVARDAAESARLAEGLRAYGLGVLVAWTADEACDHVRRGGVGALVCDPVVEGPEGTPLVDYPSLSSARPPVVSSAPDVAAVAERVRALGGRFRELALTAGVASPVRPPSSAGLVELRRGASRTCSRRSRRGRERARGDRHPEALGHVAVEAGRARRLRARARDGSEGARARARRDARHGARGRAPRGVLRAPDRPARIRSPKRPRARRRRRGSRTCGRTSRGSFTCATARSPGTTPPPRAWPTASSSDDARAPARRRRRPRRRRPRRRAGAPRGAGRAGRRRRWAGGAPDRRAILEVRALVARGGGRGTATPRAS